jgi:endonuclease G
MRYIILLLTLYCSYATAWEQTPPLPMGQCQAQAPYGFPQTNKPGVAICRTGYATLNDTTAKIPVWTSYVLTPEHALGCVPRSNAFAPDQSLSKGQRAELADYAKSGFDIGHIVPNADTSYSDLTEKESFLLSNMAPQIANLNRGSWKAAESSVRGWVTQRKHPYVIYIGSLYGPNDKTIGLNKVVVPHAFYKITIDAVTNEVAGFLFPHAGGLGKDLTLVRAPISQIEQESGVKFAYPKNAVELPLTQIWPVDFGQLIKDKKAVCGK